MINIKDPQQINLFDLESSFLSDLALERLETSFYSVFRHVILSLLPAQEISKHFNVDTGRPTKEIYSMAGLLLLKEFRNWTTSEATEAYLFDYRVQYALNIGRDNISFCERTLERYMTIMREDNLAIEIFDNVTAKLIEELGLQINTQRLDSTHVFSDMATFAKTKLMGVAIKRFFVQVKRHHPETYETIDPELRARYEKNQNALFADHSKDKKKRGFLRQEVAEELHQVITFFNGDAQIEKMDTYKKLIQIFNEQCEIISPIKVEADTETDDPPKTSDGEQSEEETKLSHLLEDVEIKIKKKTGGNVIQNPSDPDATYDGHKGVGYQVQICETADAENDVQLVTAILVETAVESDANALEPVMEKLEKSGLLPDELQADTLYGSDTNHQFSAQKGTNLISPVCGPAPGKPIEKPTEAQRRLAKRREEQESEDWKKNYNLRAQIEGTIGSIKRLTGMVRLRYRGIRSVSSAIELKLTGWNISRAQNSEKMQKKLAKIIKERRGAALPGVSVALLCRFEPNEYLEAA